MAMMKVYVGYSKDPIAIETNLAWAIPYWTKAKQRNPKLRWVFV
jgi:hypothetical protein